MRELFPESVSYLANQQSLVEFLSWKQLLGRLDSLREAWEARKQALSDLGRRGADPTQIHHLTGDADSNVGQ